MGIGNILIGAGIGAGVSAATGGDITTGAVAGAFGGGIGGTIGKSFAQRAASQSLQGITTAGAAGAVAGGAGASAISRSLTRRPSSDIPLPEIRAPRPISVVGTSTDRLRAERLRRRRGSFITRRLGSPKLGVPGLTGIN